MVDKTVARIGFLKDYVLAIKQCILSSALILLEGVFCEKQERGSGEEPAKQGPDSSWDLQVLLYHK